MSITLKKPAGATAAPKDAKPIKASQDTRGAKVRAKLKQGGIATAKALWRTLIVLAPFLLPLGLALTLSEGTDRWPAALEYLLDHIALVLIPLIPTLYGVIYVIRNYQRTHPPKNKNGRPVRPAEPAQPSLSQRTKDAADIIGNLDSIPWRAAMIGGFLAATLTAGAFLPVSVDDFAAAGATITSDPTGTVMDLLGPLVLILAAYGLIFARVASIVRGREDELGQIYAVARDTLDYPKRKPASPTRRQRTLLVPHLAIDVKKWRSLENVDTFFVTAPEELSVTDIEKWDDFSANLNAKIPNPAEWRVQRDPRGRGATVGPANYPRAVLWDGEYEEDPLTFRLGINLDSGEMQYITLGDVSPHLTTSGGTSSGKTSGAEILAAQILITPMPWDRNLYGTVDIVDPKGPFGRRWAGRPGVTVSNGTDDSGITPNVVDEETGDILCPYTGILVMADHVRVLVEEHERRQKVLGRYPDAATWIDLPGEVKRAEQFAPKLIIFDEFLDHMSNAAGKDARTELENEAREFIRTNVDYLLRKARNVGFHIDVIAQRANMKLIGDTMMTNMPVRMVTGQIDPSQLESMFGVKPSMVPSLPSTVPGTNPPKTIPGRARIMNAAGQTIHTLQVMYFGGSTNSDTLDKWLPRGPKPPNGDFTRPPGKPRRPEDFDEEGNLIEPPNAIPAVEDTDPSHDPEGEPETGGAASADAVAQPQLTGDDEKFIDESPTLSPPPAPKIDLDKDAVFPAAQAHSPRCGHPKCVNDADRQCPGCQAPRCEQHVGPHPDPAQNALMCSQCRANEPLVRFGVEDLYRDLHSLSRRGGLLPSYQVGAPSGEEDDGSLVMTAWTPKKQKVVEVTATADELTARSRAGTVTGDGVHDTVEETLMAYIRLREQPAPDADPETEEADS